MQKMFVNRLQIKIRTEVKLYVSAIQKGLHGYEDNKIQIN